MYRTIVFMQGDDYDEFRKHVETETAEWWPGTAEWVLSAYDYLSQWDYGEPTEDESDSEPWGSADEVYTAKEIKWADDKSETYYVTHNGSLGYVGLTVRFESE